MTTFLESLTHKLIVAVTALVTTLSGATAVPPPVKEVPTQPQITKEEKISAPTAPSTEPTQEKAPAEEIVAPLDNPPLSEPNEIIEKLSFIDKPYSSFFLKEVLVNIYCTFESTGPDKPLTASGVVIDPRGVILTNAHVAQYILLRDFAKEGQVECVARTGSPAKGEYEVELLYISPEWIEENSDNLFKINSQGTGENDYAFLLIKDTLDGEDLPETFTYTPLTFNSEYIKKNEPIMVGGYPADVLDSLSVRHVLFSHVVRTNIKRIMTFGENFPDVISTGGSFLAQKGSSGGAVLNEKGQLIGLVVTSTGSENQEDRDLRAITMLHINKSLQDYSRVSVRKLLNGNLENTAEEFNDNIAPLLADILFEELESR